MAYNSAFPVSYQQPMYVQPVQQQQQNNSIIWVSGEAGAKAYLVAPNTTVQLWDSEAQTIYLKSADASGMPTMKVLDYTIRDQAAASSTPTLMRETPDYVTHSELSALEDRLLKQIDRLTPVEKVTPKRKREVDDE